MIGRYGGEEFVVILSSADAAAAQPIAERIRERVAELECRASAIRSPDLQHRRRDQRHARRLGRASVARADAAVYAAKSSGRNRVQVAAQLAA